MSSLAEQMKAYESVLWQHKSSLDVPVTEIVIFKLLEDPTDETTESIEREFISNSIKGEGVNRTAWGYSLDDPRTVLIMFDWRRIQDHWAFWQTSHFPAVMGCIEKLFQPGRPLVRHYKFNPVGMLQEEYVRVLVWDEQTEVDSDKLVQAVGSKAQSQKGGFAVDMDEMTWFCTLLGYESESAAKSDQVQPKGETHLVKLKFY